MAIRHQRPLRPAEHAASSGGSRPPAHASPWVRKHRGTRSRQQSQPGNSRVSRREESGRKHAGFHQGARFCVALQPIPPSPLARLTPTPMTAPSPGSGERRCWPSHLSRRVTTRDWPPAFTPLS